MTLFVSSYHVLKIRERKYTGAGYFLTLDIPD